MSRWWYLAVFAPILNLWLGYRCVACPPGYAYYKKMDAAGIGLAILYWSSVLAGAYILSRASAPLLEMIQNVEWSNHINTAIRDFKTS
jgi:hypothetical protein